MPYDKGTIERTKFVLVEPGEYLSEIVDVNAADGEYGPQLKFTFKLLDTEDDAELTGWTSEKFTGPPRSSKLYDWAKAALGSNFNADADDFDPNSIIGSHVLLEVSQHQSSNRAVYNKIDLIRFGHAPKN